uniref:C-type lectin domain-containing protein n=1 Tax=Erpetoichthys calabaricus TaxID=27687 RepID=A0A8C4X3V4_ERPCA
MTSIKQSTGQRSSRATNKLLMNRMFEFPQEHHRVKLPFCRTHITAEGRTSVSVLSQSSWLSVLLSCCVFILISIYFSYLGNQKHYWLNSQKLCKSVSLCLSTFMHSIVSYFCLFHHKDSGVFSVSCSVHCNAMSVFLLQDRVKNHIKDQLAGGNYWIGLNSYGSDWYWVDGTTMEAQRLSSCSDGSSGNCAFITVGGLKTSNCATKNRWICEKRIAGTDTRQR